MVPTRMPDSPTQNKPKHQESKAGQRAVTAGVILAFAFGLIVPAVILADNIDSGGSTYKGVHLTAEEEKGRELFSKTCYVCHTLAATNSVGRVGPNLDVRIGQEIPTEAARRALVLATILEGRAIGRGNMPADLYEGKQAEDVADFVAAVAGH